MKRTTGSRLLVGAMSMCLLAGMLPVQARAARGGRAEEKVYSINLQKDGAIAGIGSPESTGVAAAEWEGSRLYFGGFDSKPVLWRVLDKGLELSSGKKLMLLQSDRVLENRAFAGSLGGQPQTVNAWAGSEVQTYLNLSSTGGFLAHFSAAEQGSLYSYGKAAENNSTVSDGDQVTNPALSSGEKVFLLSAGEALKPEFGFGSDKARKLKNLNGAAASWWLRSSLKNDTVKLAVVKAGGGTDLKEAVSPDGSYPSDGIAPALYLDTSEILFTTRSENGKGDFGKVTELTGAAEWKLTLQGSGSDMGAALSGGALHERGETVTLNHNSAGSCLQGANQVSAMITDANGTPLYYGKVGADMGAASTSFALPGEIPAGNYLLYLFAEQVNGNKRTDYASSLGSPVSLTVDATITPVIATPPTAGAITYGQTLASSAFSGGAVSAGGAAVAGGFSWRAPETAPTVADSGVTEYEAVFTPADSSLYKTAVCKVRLTVNKAAQAPNPPAPVLNVDYGVTRVSGAALPQGWSWKAEDALRELAVGNNQATAVYQDTVNYESCSAAVTIVRNDCAHTGGTAACTRQAVCDICHQPYGAVNPAQHGQTELRGVKAASCTEKGYTGDACCRDCGQAVAKGQEIAALGHDYEAKVTREPTLDADGIRTYTCKRCGDHYDENMGRHSHYYNGTKVLHYVGCVQQGEVEHICGCGDSYIEVTPALGHDFTSAITTKPTTGRAGVKTYTCRRCGYQYTEALPKLNGGTGGSGSGAGNGGTASIPDRVPYVKGDSSLSGWNGINKAAGKAEAGETINIGMNETMLLPQKTLETLKGKDVTLVLDIGNQIKWSVNGKDISSDSLADINLKVTKNSAGIPGDLVSDLAGEASSLQFSLVHEGDFGAKMTLLLPVDSGKAGYYANLFYYNKNSGALEYVGSSQMDGKGTAGLEMTHASDYLIVADTKIIDGAKPEEPAAPPAEEPVEQPEESVPAQGPGPQASDGPGMAVNVILIIGLVVLGAGILIIVLLRARNKSADWA